MIIIIDEDTLLGLLSQLKRNMMPDKSLLCVDVRRELVLVDALREAKKKKFDPKKHLKVVM